MPALDKIHHAVQNALKKDGWTITEDPYSFSFEEIRLYADLGVERPLGARRGERKLVVETKSFTSVSPVHDFKLALGQYLLYQTFLEVLAPEREVFLAIDSDTFQEFFEQKAIQFVLQRYPMALIIVDLEKEEIVQWIK